MNWTPPKQPLYFIPWLLLLALLLPKRNRSVGVFAVLIPLICNLALTAFVMMISQQNEPGIMNVCLYGLSYALAAIWLLMPWIRSRSWITRFFYLFCLISLVSVPIGLTYVDSEKEDLYLFAIALVALSFVVSLILAVCGRICEKRFNFPRFILWLFPVTAIVTIVVFFVPVIYPFVDFILAFGYWIGGSILLCMMMIPYLIVSAIVPFFTYRMEAFIGSSERVPPVIPPAAPPKI